MVYNTIQTSVSTMQADEQIKEALELHQKGELDKATEAYEKVIKKKVHDKRIYTNFAAILRSQGNAERAAHIANEGLRHCGAESPILLNTLGNALKDLQRYDEAINVYRRAIRNAPDYFDPKLSLLGSLMDGGYEKLFDLCLRSMIKKYGAKNKALINQAIIREVNMANSEQRGLNKGLEELMKIVDIENKSTEKIPEHWYLMAQLCCKNERIEESKRFYEKATRNITELAQQSKSNDFRQKAKTMHVISSWNYGCQLIRRGEFKLGWKLFEYGLKTPAPGPQRWQRSLYKPFSSGKINIWRGEALKDKSILLLGEQGIGDSMMFMTLLPKLIKEGAKITLIVPERLYEIYTRSLKECTVVADKHCKENPLKFEYFNFQSPLGSIVQHRFKSLQEFKGRDFCLVPDQQKTKELRKKYLKNSGRETKIVGLSWQGGGTKDRINEKSVKLKELLQALKGKNIVLLSLQYGDDREIVEHHSKFTELEFIDDEEIQATKDMNSWLNQVNACDAIISIANTTIHGAGGLNKPTLCLLSQKADWRWIKDESIKQSYWYPTVEIAWQQIDGSWGEAFQGIDQWLEKHKIT